MPLYDYRCQNGHLFEELRPMEIETMPCRACSLPANRVPFNRIRIVKLDVFEYDGRDIKAAMQVTNGRLELDSIQTRQKFRDYMDASQESNYLYEQAEKDLGTPIQSPDVWAAAKEGAKQIISAGEAPLPAHSGKD